MIIPYHNKLTFLFILIGKTVATKEKDISLGAAGIIVIIMWNMTICKIISKITKKFPQKTVTTTIKVLPPTNNLHLISVISELPSEDSASLVICPFNEVRGKRVRQVFCQNFKAPNLNLEQT